MGELGRHSSRETQQWGKQVCVPETSMIPTYFKTQCNILPPFETNSSLFETADISPHEDKVFSFIRLMMGLQQGH